MNSCGLSGQQIPHRPDRVGHASGHAGRHPDGCVHPDKVVPRYPETHAGFVIVQLAAMRVRPADVTAEMGTNTKVQSFDMACTDEARLGLSAPDAWKSPRTRLMALIQSGPR